MYELVFRLTLKGCGSLSCDDFDPEFSWQEITIIDQTEEMLRRGSPMYISAQQELEKVENQEFRDVDRYVHYFLLTLLYCGTARKDYCTTTIELIKSNTILRCIRWPDHVNVHYLGRFWHYFVYPIYNPWSAILKNQRSLKVCMLCYHTVLDFWPCLSCNTDSK
jgi:hypothetical protein